MKGSRSRLLEKYVATVCICVLPCMSFSYAHCCCLDVRYINVYVFVYTHKLLVMLVTCSNKRAAFICCSYSFCLMLNYTKPFRNNILWYLFQKFQHKNAPPLLSRCSLIGSILAYKKWDHGSNTRSDISNTTKYEKIFLWQLPVSRFLAKILKFIKQ